jgi:hypothetical protein
MVQLVTLRSAALWGVLGLTLLASVWIPEKPSSVLVEEVKPPRHAAEATKRNPLEREVFLALPERRPSSKPARDAFLSPSREPARPPVMALAAVKAAPATAPPLPFNYFGRMESDRETLVFLFSPDKDRNYVLKTGEVLDDAYRLERIEPGFLTFTYLPLKIKQTLQIGEGRSS